MNADSGKVKGGGKSRRTKSIRQFFRRKSSEVLSYLTIMTTWLLFRFLLKGLNKVTGWLPVFVSGVGGGGGGGTCFELPKHGVPCG